MRLLEAKLLAAVPQDLVQRHGSTVVLVVHIHIRLDLCVHCAKMLRGFFSSSSDDTPGTGPEHRRRPWCYRGISRTVVDSGAGFHRIAIFYRKYVVLGYADPVW